MIEPEVLVDVTRGPLTENRHRGHIAVVDLTGKLLYSLGDPYHVTYWRSSAKPIQALPVVESGAAERYGFTQAQVALFCASHSGEEFHTRAVEEILKAAGLDPSLLNCGVHMPYHAETARQMQQQGVEAQTMHSNCSGKHSGMLSLAKHLDFDLDEYTQVEHPLQQLILDYIADLTCYNRDKILLGIDGCGVPVHGLPLFNMSLAYARLAKPHDLSPSRAQACKTITAAMLAHPEMVGGTDRFCTELMRNTGGKLIGKAGAAGVYSVGLLDKGIGISVKCEDGAGRGRDPAVLEVLAQLGILSADELKTLAKFHKPQNTNHRQDVCGQVVPVFKLEKR